MRIHSKMVLLYNKLPIETARWPTLNLRLFYYNILASQDAEIEARILLKNGEIIGNILNRTAAKYKSRT